MITLQHYLILALMLFAIGMAGVLTRKNTILVFISLEIMLNAVNLVFLAAAYYLKDGAGQVMVVFSMTVAAAEAAIGLAIVLMLFHHARKLSIEDFQTLKG